MGAENRGDTFCEDRTEVALEKRRGRERKSSIRPPVASLPTSSGSMALAGTSVRCWPPRNCSRTATRSWAVFESRACHSLVTGPIKPPSIAAHDAEHEKVRSKQARFTRAPIDHLNGE
jgi:hypothetical protein